MRDNGRHIRTILNIEDGRGMESAFYASKGVASSHYSLVQMSRVVVQMFEEGANLATMRRRGRVHCMKETRERRDRRQLRARDERFSAIDYEAYDRAEDRLVVRYPH